jgi:hypothetical protein
MMLREKITSLTTMKWCFSIWGGVAMCGVIGGHDADQVDKVADAHFRHQPAAMRLDGLVADSQ